MLLLADTVGATPYLIALLGSGGVLGALLGFFKLRGDRDSQAVTQAIGAMETMETLNDSLEKALARANERTDFYKSRCDELSRQLDAINRRWGPFELDEP